ncbi:MAG: tautomerase family protein [Pseudonocardia sp.]|nr:tautomerase family protein [Pseudonocardia sp.]
MPLVRIDIVEGRPRESIAELHRRVALLVAEVLDSPLDRVRTYITEIPASHWGIGGTSADIARADEIEARRAAAGRPDVTGS